MNYYFLIKVISVTDLLTVGSTNNDKTYQDRYCCNIIPLVLTSRYEVVVFVALK